MMFAFIAKTSTCSLLSLKIEWTKDKQQQILAMKISRHQYTKGDGAWKAHISFDTATHAEIRMSVKYAAIHHRPAASQLYD